MKHTVPLSRKRGGSPGSSRGCTCS